MKARILAWVIPLLIIGAAAFSTQYIDAETPYIPTDFIEARIRSRAIAENIMELSRTGLTRIDEIASLDRERKHEQALLIVLEELLQTNRIREEGARLASQLGRMAHVISEIEPAEARAYATEAVTAEVALVTRLMTHNAYLAELFDVLQIKFTDSTKNVDGKVNELVNKINDEAKAINQFNRNFNEALLKFDALIGQ